MSNSACWFNAIIIITRVLSVDDDGTRRVTHLVVASVNVNSEEDNALDAVLEMYGLVMEGRAYE